jgi:hypothetical protein
MNRAIVYLQQPESRARTTQRTCRSMTLSTSFKCSPIVRLPHPEERLAAGEGDPHPLPDRVQVFPGERENVGQEGAGPSGFPAVPPVSLADSPSPPKAPRRAREGRWQFLVP